jgi:hypothetical protein
MMDARSYNSREIREGRLTAEHLLVILRTARVDLEGEIKTFQRLKGLHVDGCAGPDTQAVAVDKPLVSHRCYPLRCLDDGRKPVETSAYKTRNPSRPTHCGSDFFYRYRDDDPDVPALYRIIKRGRRRWWYPTDVAIVAAAAGEVTIAGETGTGHRLWVDHGDGTRTGYFHCRSLLVARGTEVDLGDPIAMPGASPKGGKVHLHFEWSPSGYYQPRDPLVWLAGAAYLAG